MRYGKSDKSKSFFLGYSPSSGINMDILFQPTGAAPNKATTAKPDVPEKDFGYAVDTEMYDSRQKEAARLNAAAIRKHGGWNENSQNDPMAQEAAELLRMGMTETRIIKKEEEGLNIMRDYITAEKGSNASQVYMKNGKWSDYKYNPMTGELATAGEVFDMRTRLGSGGKVGVGFQGVYRGDDQGQWGFQTGERISTNILTNTPLEAGDTLRGIFAMAGKTGSSSGLGKNSAADQIYNLLSSAKSESNVTQLHTAISNLTSSLDQGTLGGLFTEFSTSPAYVNWRQGRAEGLKKMYEENATDEELEAAGITRQEIADQFNNFLYGPEIKDKEGARDYQKGRIYNIAMEQLSTSYDRSWIKDNMKDGVGGIDDKALSSWPQLVMSGLANTIGGKEVRQKLMIPDGEGRYRSFYTTSMQVGGGVEWLNDKVKMHSKEGIALESTDKSIGMSTVAIPANLLFDNAAGRAVMFDVKTGMAMSLADMGNRNRATKTNALEMGYVLSSDDLVGVDIIQDELWASTVKHLNKFTDTGVIRTSSQLTDAIRKMNAAQGDRAWKDIIPNMDTEGMMKIKAMEAYAAAFFENSPGSRLEDIPTKYVKTRIVFPDAVSSEFTFMGESMSASELDYPASRLQASAVNSSNVQSMELDPDRTMDTKYNTSFFKPWSKERVYSDRDDDTRSKRQVEGARYLSGKGITDERFANALVYEVMVPFIPTDAGTWSDGSNRPSGWNQEILMNRNAGDNTTGIGGLRNIK